MKKFYRICGLAIIVGLVMMLVGWSNNGVRPIIANHNHFTLTAIDDSKLTRTYTSNHKFNKVFIQTDSSDVFLHSGKKYQVNVTGVNPDAVQVKLANNRLDIYEPRPIAINWRKIGSRIDVTVPQNVHYTEFDSDSDHGNIRLKDLKANANFVSCMDGYLDIDNIDMKNTSLITGGNHRLTINNSDLGNAELKIDGGWCRLLNCRSTMTLDASNANITINNSQLSNRNSFTLQSSNLVIKNAPNLSYQLTADGKAIRYKGSKPYENFIKKNSKKNFLLVDSTEGTITIK